jgi:ribosomal protein S12 methylthiotransferase accessory factor
MLARLRSAGVVFAIDWVPNRFQVPCFAAWIWSADLPVTFLGFGAHSAPEVALSRAVTEAAQSRLTAIAGTREDLPPIYEQIRHAGGDPPNPAAAAANPTDAAASRADAAAGWADIITGHRGGGSDLGHELTRLSTRVLTVTGFEPLRVDLSTDDDFAVVKVIVPGTGSDFDRFHSPG